MYCHYAAPLAPFTAYLQMTPLPLCLIKKLEILNGVHIAKFVVSV